MSIRRQEALDYHSQGRPGKIQVSPTKPFKNQRDLSLAYTPGVAEPCREIAGRPEEAYTYTAKGNLVAVVTNGTAVLGLGNIGPLAGKPVMEGKGILFKAFADIDVFDLEVGSEDPDDMIRLCQLLEQPVVKCNLSMMTAQKGEIPSERADLAQCKRRFARRTEARTGADALHGADVFVGWSAAGIVSGDMLQGMAPWPIVFALANPTPEIMPDEARRARGDRKSVV